MATHAHLPRRRGSAPLIVSLDALADPDGFAGVILPQEALNAGDNPLTWAHCQTGLTPSLWNTLHALVRRFRHFYDNDGEFFIALSRLEDYLPLSPRTVKNHITRLHKLGLLKLVRRAGNGTTAPSLWAFCTDTFVAARQRRLPMDAAGAESAADAPALNAIAASPAPDADAAPVAAIAVADAISEAAPNAPTEPKPAPTHSDAPPPAVAAADAKPAPPRKKPLWDRLIESAGRRPAKRQTKTDSATDAPPLIPDTPFMQQARKEIAELGMNANEYRLRVLSTFERGYRACHNKDPEPYLASFAFAETKNANPKRFFAYLDSVLAAVAVRGDTDRVEWETIGVKERNARRKTAITPATPAAAAADPLPPPDGPAWARGVRIAAGPPCPAQLWDAAKEELKRQLPPPSYKTWVEDTRGVGYAAGNALIIAAPNAYAASTLERQMGHLVARALETAAGRPMDAVYSAADGGG